DRSGRASPADLDRVDLPRLHPAIVADHQGGEAGGGRRACHVRVTPGGTACGGRLHIISKTSSRRWSKNRHARSSDCQLSLSRDAARESQKHERDENTKERQRLHVAGPYSGSVSCFLSFVLS